MAEQHARAVQYRRKEFADQLNYEILLTLAIDTGRNNEPATTGYRAIAERVGCHYNTIPERVNQLVKDGWLNIQKNGKLHCYFVTIDCHNHCDNQKPKTTLSQFEAKNVTMNHEESANSVHGSDSTLSQFSVTLSQLEKTLSQKLDTIVTMLVEKNVTEDIVSKKEDKEDILPQAAKTERQVILSELEKFFSQVSGLAIPKRKTEGDKKAAASRWWHPLWEMYETAHDLEKTKRIISECVVEMRKPTSQNPQGLVISAPGSIQKNFLSRCANNGGIPIVDNREAEEMFKQILLSAAKWGRMRFKEWEITDLTRTAIKRIGGDVITNLCGENPGRVQKQFIEAYNDVKQTTAA